MFSVPCLGIALAMQGEQEPKPKVCDSELEAPPARELKPVNRWPIDPDSQAAYVGLTPEVAAEARLKDLLKSMDELHVHQEEEIELQEIGPKETWRSVRDFTFEIGASRRLFKERANLYLNKGAEKAFHRNTREWNRHTQKYLKSAEFQYHMIHESHEERVRVIQLLRPLYDENEM